MKKFAIVAGVMLVASGAAFAFSLGVPFFADNGETGTSAALPTSGSRAFVGLHNNTLLDIVITLAYVSSDGTPLVQQSLEGVDSDADGEIDSFPPFLNSGAENYRNTGLIPALSTVSFRPSSTDTAQESLAARRIPNKPSWWHTKHNGSIAVSWGSTGVVGALGAIIFGSGAADAVWPLSLARSLSGMGPADNSIAIQGRLLEQIPNGQSAFLLAPGG